MSEFPERHIEFSAEEKAEILRRCEALKPRHIQIIKAVCEQGLELNDAAAALKLKSLKYLRNLLDQIYHILQLKADYSGNKLPVLKMAWEQILKSKLNE